MDHKIVYEVLWWYHVICCNAFITCGDKCKNRSHFRNMIILATKRLLTSLPTFTYVHLFDFVCKQKALTRRPYHIFLLSLCLRHAKRTNSKGGHEHTKLWKSCCNNPKTMMFTLVPHFITSSEIFKWFLFLSIYCQKH